MKIGDLINKKYKIIEEIGRGGMGKVFKVTYRKTDLALKVCLAKDAESIQRFRREVRMMAKIKHANVIDVIDSKLDIATPYFVMPLCKCSIDDEIDSLLKKPKLALRIIKQVCKGINAIHLSGVIHRDIKPQNILIDVNNQIKISDLGLGKFGKRDSTVLTSSNVYMGTAGYIPPEFYSIGGTKDADERSDIFQLGKLIYKVFTNLNPAQINKEAIPGGLFYIVQKCISEDPNDRYQKIDELADSLNNYLLSLDPENNPISSFEHQLSIAKENLLSNEYEPGNIESIFQLLFGFKDEPEIFFRQSNKIPSKVFGIMSSDYKALCKSFMKIYSAVIDKYFRKYHPDFSEAGPVADTMNTIFRRSKDMSVKVKTMEITLFVAVYCHRYYSMGIFDQMLKSIQKDHDALIVKEMLLKNQRYYQVVADRVPRAKLHHYFHSLQSKILKRNESKGSYEMDL